MKNGTAMENYGASFFNALLIVFGAFQRFEYKQEKSAESRHQETKSKINTSSRTEDSEKSGLMRVRRRIVCEGNLSSSHSLTKHRPSVEYRTSAGCTRSICNNASMEPALPLHSFKRSSKLL